MLETLRTARGVIRSLGIYYGWQQRSRAAAMRTLYANFVRRDDLVFDIGAHVGDRVLAFRRLGWRRRNAATLHGRRDRSCPLLSDDPERAGF